MVGPADIDGWFAKYAPRAHRSSSSVSERQYVFETTCVSARGEDIREMVDDPRQRTVSYDTMLSKCRGMLDVARDLGYEKSSRAGHGLTLRNDWHVSYHRSFYRGKPCYYFRWSGIEHIWVKR